MYFTIVMNDKLSLLKAFTVITIAYAAAYVASSFSVRNFASENSMLATTFYADVIATTIIFIFSLAFQNSSFYDPYWSVSPFVIALFWNSASDEKNSFRNNLIIAVFLTWGIRLTLNWVRGWKGLQHEDWRYSALKERTSSLYPAVNFLGIHLFPTCMVFVAMIPAYYAMMNASSQPVNGLDILATFVCLTATIIELVADEQQRSFRYRRTNQRMFCSEGLWKYSRHPNYFGEVLFWWGIYLFVPASNPSYSWTIIGAVAMTVLFIFISIPMMEKHLMEKYPDYVQYQNQVSALIPWFQKK